MRLLSYTVLLALLSAILVVFATCGKGRGPSSPAVNLADAVASIDPAARGQPELTAEDEMLLEMPYEQRLQYLRQRYRELVFELHGIRIEDDDAAKSVSGDDEDHKVCKYDTVNRLPKENLVLTREGNSWQWNLSFSERLCGDYDWSGRVAIADITPLAIHFQAKEEDEGWFDGPYNIDRLGDDNGRISIADITPLARNFGKHLVGYNVYFLPYNQAGWQQSGKLLARWRLTDTGNWEDTGYPTSESFQTA